jgi:ATP-dependent Lon protease
MTGRLNLVGSTTVFFQDDPNPIGPTCSGRASKSHAAMASMRDHRLPTGSLSLDVGGTMDARTLEGTARGWRGAQPCWPAVAVAQTEVANPILLIDELDKIDQRDGAGSVDGVLLAMLERSTAARYFDRALMAEIDLSAVCWLLSVNDVTTLTPALRSRIDIVRLEGPTPQHFDLVLQSVLGNVAVRLGVAPEFLPALPQPVVDMVRRAFSSHRSVRRLQRHVEDVVATLALSSPGTIQ